MIGEIDYSFTVQAPTLAMLFQVAREKAKDLFGSEVPWEGVRHFDISDDIVASGSQRTAAYEARVTITGRIEPPQIAIWNGEGKLL